MTPSSATRYPTPEALFERWREYGDAQALGELFDATAPALFRIALSLLPDAATAEDAVQETWLAAMEDAGRWDATRPIVPWLVGILQMQVRRQRRHRARVPDPVRVLAAASEADPDAEAHRDDESARVREAIDALDEPYRSVALLRWRYGLSPAEIADVRAEPPGTTRSLLSRAVAKMRSTLRFLPAAFVGARLPRGLKAVRDAVVGGAIPAAAAGTATVAVMVVLKWAVGVAAVAAVATGGWLTWEAFHGDDATPRDEAASVLADGESGPATPPPPLAGPTLRGSPDRPKPTGPSERTSARVGAVRPAGGGASSPGDGEGLAAAVGATRPGELAAAAEAKPEDGGQVDPFPAAITHAIDAARKWLLLRQQAAGWWPSEPEGEAGRTPPEPDASCDATTALALYALLKTGTSPDDVAFVRGYRWLMGRSATAGNVTEAALRLLVQVAREEARRHVDPGDPLEVSAEARDPIRRGVANLTESWQRNRWTDVRVAPEMPPTEPAADLSAMDWATLALVSSMRVGRPASESLWTRILDTALARQELHGVASPRALGEATETDRARGFAEPIVEAMPERKNVTAQRTAAGLSVVLAARYALGNLGIRQSRSAASPPRVQTAVYDAAAWLDSEWPEAELSIGRHLDEDLQRQREGVEGRTLAWAIHLEHAMAFLGTDRLGARRWHRAISDLLLRVQRPNGGWAAQFHPPDVARTASVLLFLSKASRPYVKDPSIGGPERSGAR